MIVFDSAQLYIESKVTLRAKIIAIDAIITALETTALQAAATGNVSEYFLDTGQTKIRSVYRSPAEVSNSITAFEAIRQRYINRLNGRMTRLMDSRNFTQRGI